MTMIIMIVMMMLLFWIILLNLFLNILDFDQKEFDTGTEIQIGLETTTLTVGASSQASITIACSIHLPI